MFTFCCIKVVKKWFYLKLKKLQNHSFWRVYSVLRAMLEKCRVSCLIMSTAMLPTLYSVVCHYLNVLDGFPSSYILLQLSNIFNNFSILMFLWCIFPLFGIFMVYFSSFGIFMGFMVFLWIFI